MSHQKAVKSVESRRKYLSRRNCTQYLKKRENGEKKLKKLAFFSSLDSDSPAGSGIRPIPIEELLLPREEKTNFAEKMKLFSPISTASEVLGTCNSYPLGVSDGPPFPCPELENRSLLDENGSPHQKRMTPTGNQMCIRT
jgi:hypothetical protein